MYNCIMYVQENKKLYRRFWTNFLKSPGTKGSCTIILSQDWTEGMVKNSNWTGGYAQNLTIGPEVMVKIFTIGQDVIVKI